MYGTRYGDEYYFSAGDGYNTIYDWSGTNTVAHAANKLDSIIFDNTVDHNNIEFSKSGNNLRIYNIVTNDNIYVKNWFYTGYNLGF